MRGGTAEGVVQNEGVRKAIKLGFVFGVFLGKSKVREKEKTGRGNGEVNGRMRPKPYFPWPPFRMDESFSLQGLWVHHFQIPFLLSLPILCVVPTHPSGLPLSPSVATSLDVLHVRLKLICGYLQRWVFPFLSQPWCITGFHPLLAWSPSFVGFFKSDQVGWNPITPVFVIVGFRLDLSLTR